MIQQGYVSQMARYNRWQNGLAVGAADGLDDAGLRLDRGAFFGSVLRTFSHILWADAAWMARIDGWAPPETPFAQSTEHVTDWLAFKSERHQMDDRIVAWASRISNEALSEERDWRPGGTGEKRSLPVAVCVMQMFNHQTHHRGQVHAMLTGAGQPGWVTDLPFLPDDI